MTGGGAAPRSLVSAFARPVSALVVGASRGIGLEIARALALDPGVQRVFAAARRAGASAGLGALRAEDSAALLDPLDVDVTDEASIAAAADAVADAAAQLDLVVNCAGLLHDDAAGFAPERRLNDVDPANIARAFAVNATGPLLVAKHVQALLPRQGRAVFASLSARVGSIGDNRLGGWYAYRASKAAQNMFTRNLSIELRRRARGAVCVALHPGTVDTELSRPFRRGVPERKLFAAPRAARRLLEVIDGLGPDDNGGFFAWDGARVPW